MTGGLFQPLALQWLALENIKPKPSSGTADPIITTTTTTMATATGTAPTTTPPPLKTSTMETRQ